MAELTNMPLFDLEPALPPVPATGDLDGLRAYLAAMPAARPEPRKPSPPAPQIGPPPRLNGLSDEARNAVINALELAAYRLSTGPQAWTTPRGLAGLLSAWACDVRFDMEPHFRGRSRRKDPADALEASHA